MNRNYKTCLLYLSVKYFVLCLAFATLIHQFEQMGEKTGWSYVNIPADIAQVLKPKGRKSFRIKGMLDAIPIQGIAILPIGEGNFILPLNANLRKN